MFDILQMTSFLTNGSKQIHVISNKFKEPEDVHNNFEHLQVSPTLTYFKQGWEVVVNRTGFVILAVDERRLQFSFSFV